MLCLLTACALSFQMISSGHSQDPWFTVVGDPAEPHADLIEVRPEPKNVGGRVLLDLRLSRSHVRSSFGGQKFRSYTARVAVNCPAREAWYLSLTYHALPLWQGAPVAHERYEEGQAAVLFKDVPHEPYKRLIKAACSTRTAVS